MADAGKIIVTTTVIGAAGGTVGCPGMGTLAGAAIGALAGVFMAGVGFLMNWIS